MHRAETVLPLGARFTAINAFERFSELAKRVLAHAQAEAERANHTYVGTEHLLLGLLSEPDGLAARALGGLAIDTDAVRATIEQVVGRNGPARAVQVIPTSQLKRSIELAFEEARKMGSDVVGSEHLLLGLMVEGTSIAPHVLNDLGADEAKIRAEIERLQRQGS